MNIQQVRNATIIAEYGGKKILVDPMLGKKGSMPPFPFSRNQHLRNPLHELPFPVEEMLKGGMRCCLHIYTMTISMRQPMK